MKEVIIFSKSTPCAYCEAAKQLLKEHNISFTEIIADQDQTTKQRFRSMVPASVKTVPQIFVNDKHIGGYNDLRQRIFEVVGELNIGRKIV